ncbi:hypothetical protein [Bacillus sp. SM2101]|uniref:hypothetical protein n=1 Tax=Bacillus sp. SM2101 TaxID=2805366 RepID=UPI001BDE8172|nr:hypothetical protein [Bacillus sp. SM2101]
MTNNNVYIRSIEGSDIYSHMIRDKVLKSEYNGMIPYSLELIKLLKEGLTVHIVKHSDKQFSDDIINVKFNQRVRSGEEILKILSEKVYKINDQLSNLDEQSEEKRVKLANYNNKINTYMKVIQFEIDMDKWKEVKNDKLREYLYLNGFTITTVNDKTGEVTTDKYVVYKRSSSKSRTGQCLFIKEDLYNEMINWSRMYLSFDKESKFDYASLLAYESLVGSSLEDTIKINPNNMLIVDDVESRFNQLCNVVRKGEDGFLDSITENTQVKNSLFDGESLLDSEYFAEGQSMKLLRNHMFKSAAFNCNIQKFLRDYCPEGVNYDNWKIDNMFGESMLAKDIQFIFTPSSLKALKFSDVLDSKQDMWNYWKRLVSDEDSMFGVCKHEKKSKRGVDDNGDILQQTSYQMLNCLPMEGEDITKLTVFEKEYIHKLKSDDDFFIQHITQSANSINSNLMFVDLYNRNDQIVNTKLFRDFRKAEINKYVTHVKNGKVRLKGDYCVLLGNPMEFLYHAIGQFDVEDIHNLSLTGNEIYTTLHEFEKELVGFRNPNTSPSNVLIAKNKYVKEIKDYFNLTDNVVCVNAIKFALQDILSGCDYDSDTCLLFDDVNLLGIAKQCPDNYLVCINDVESEPKKYKMNNENMSIIDNQLATSQKKIGQVVNIGQLCMSIYWDMLKKGESENVLNKLMKKVDVMTVLSCICIDLAKKFYDTDIENEVRNVAKIPELKREKPLFWQYVSKSETIRDRVIKYDCPMDYLIIDMSDLKYGEKREDVRLLDLVVKQNIIKADRKQKAKILNYVEVMNRDIKGIYAKVTDENERNNILDNKVKYFNYRMQKLTVKPNTMYALLREAINNKSHMTTKLMNVLYTTQRQTFLNAFIHNKKVHTNSTRTVDMTAS